MKKDITSGNSKLEMLFLGELREIYGAEQHQLMILPLMKRAASCQELQNVLAGHLDTTREQIDRLEQVFGWMEQKAEAHSTEAILGIGREAEEIIAGTEKGTATRDAGLILTAQKLKHYEISTYGSLAQLARTLEYDEITDILEETLMEEKEADDLLTSIAENYINSAASRE